MNIALIAYGSRKTLMENFCIRQRHVLNKHQVFAIDSTAFIIEGILGMNVIKYLESSLGGEQQIATQIAFGEIHMVFLFADPFVRPEEAPDVSELIRLCNVYNVPLAINSATAEALIKVLEEA